jgi:hypothetical protein
MRSIIELARGTNTRGAAAFYQGLPFRRAGSLDVSRAHAAQAAGVDLGHSAGSDREPGIESYPQDKYLPSFLLRGDSCETVFHVQIAVDVEGDNFRVVTMYIPDPIEWDSGLRSREIR